MPVVDDDGHVLGIVTVDDVIDAIVREQTEDVQKFGGMEALDEPYIEIGFAAMIRKRAGWLCALFLGEMLTATAMEHFEGEIGAGGRAGALHPADHQLGRQLRIAGHVADHPGAGPARDRAARLVARGAARAARRARAGRDPRRDRHRAHHRCGRTLGFYDYGPHWPLVALTVGAALVGVVTFGSLAGSMLPFLLRRLGFDPASASAPFVATLVDVTGLVIYFSVAS